MSLYKETLMKHFRNPEFKVENLSAGINMDGVNPSCGDSLTLFIDRAGDKIDRVNFTGSGCAISMASADILCSVIPNQENPLEIIKNFKDMISGEEYNFTGDLEVLNVFQEMQDYPARRSCALLPWNTLESALTEGTK